jgi:hypothetical protein
VRKFLAGLVPDDFIVVERVFSMCCVRDCTVGNLLVKRFAENKSIFFTPRYNSYTPIHRLPSKAEAPKIKFL